MCVISKFKIKGYKDLPISVPLLSKFYALLAAIKISKKNNNNYHQCTLLHLKHLQKEIRGFS